jgi:hypothetical protein
MRLVRRIVNAWRRSEILDRFKIVILLPVSIFYFSVIPIAVFLTIHVHLDVRESVPASIGFLGIYVWVLSEYYNKLSSLAIHSERTMFTLIGLVAMNYLALYSHSIEAFIKEATR